MSLLFYETLSVLRDHGTELRLPELVEITSSNSRTGLMINSTAKVPSPAHSAWPFVALFIVVDGWIENRYPRLMTKTASHKQRYLSSSRDVLDLYALNLYRVLTVFRNGLIHHARKFRKGAHQLHIRYHQRIRGKPALRHCTMSTDAVPYIATAASILTAPTQMPDDYRAGLVRAYEPLWLAGVHKFWDGARKPTALTTSSALRHGRRYVYRQAPAVASRGWEFSLPPKSIESFAGIDFLFTHGGAHYLVPSELLPANRRLSRRALKKFKSDAKHPLSSLA